jgi:phage terminase small subunit
MSVTKFLTDILPASATKFEAKTLAVYLKKIWFADYETVVPTLEDHGWIRDGDTFIKKDYLVAVTIYRNSANTAEAYKEHKEYLKNVKPTTIHLSFR